MRARAVRGAVVASLALAAGCASHAMNRPGTSGRPVTCLEGQLSSKTGCVQVVQLALGDRHSCARLASGGVMCWGDNSLGQLGDGTGKGTRTPVRVQHLDDATDIAASLGTTCARRATGRVACWGANDRGQVVPDRRKEGPPFPLPREILRGSDRAEDADFENVRAWPVLVPSVDDATQVSLGNGFSCALRRTGTVTCWGDDSASQLGSKTPEGGFLERDIAGVVGAVELRSAGLYSCARSNDGSVICWGGYNETAQLGHPSNDPSPRKVQSVRGAVALLLDSKRACALNAAGTPFCWGSRGECAATTKGVAPAAAPELGRLKQLATADAACFTCTLGPDGEVDCHSSEDDETRRLALPKISQISAGTEHACALARDGRVFCWGENAAGQLGRATASDVDVVPAPVEWE